MPAPLFVIAALAAAQPAVPAQLTRGRTFISPMGEPFRTGDGLTAWFNAADQNRDGSITLVEFQKDAERFYQTLDANHDGEVDPDEIDHYETVVAPEVRTGNSFNAGENTDDEATGGGRLGLLTIPEPVTAADSNLDRGVSLHEFVTAAEKRFQLLDRDGNGLLTLPELEAQRSAVRANARHPKREHTQEDDQSPGIAEQQGPPPSY